MMSFMRPLSNEVWLVLAGSVLVGGLALWFTSCITSSRHQVTHGCTLDRLADLWNSLWVIFGASVLQGGETSKHVYVCVRA